MPAIISSDNGSFSGSSGLKYNGGSADGILQLQTGNNVTAVSISADQIVNVANSLIVTGTSRITGNATFGNVTITGAATLPSTGVTAGTYGSSSNVSVITINTQGQITSASNVAITPSAMTLISTQTANNSSSSIAFTGLSGYDKYMLTFENINLVAPGGSGTIYLQLGTGATPTYLTSGYISLSVYTNSSTPAGTSNTAGGTYMPLVVPYQISAANGVSSGIINILGTLGGSNTTFHGSSAILNNLTGTSNYYSTIWGNVNTPSPITAIKVVGGSGGAAVNPANMTSGNVSLYGIAS
jgi:hypothetical protein